MPGFPSIGLFAENYQKNEKTAPSGAALQRMGQVCIEEAGKK